MRVILFLAVSLISTPFFPSLGQCPDSAGIDQWYANDAVDDLVAAIEQMDSCQTEQSLKAYALHQLSRLYNQQGAMEQALASAEGALQIREAVLPPGDPDLGRTLFMLGLCHRKLGNFTLAESFLDRSDAIFRPQENVPALIMIQKELSEVAEGIGDFKKASELLQNNIDLTQQLEDPIWEADSRVDLSNVLLSLKEPSAALATLTLAEALYLKHPNAPGYQAANLYACYLNTAFAHDELEQPEKAMEYYQKAIQGFRREQNSYEEAKARANLSLTYIQLGQLRKAEWELGTARNLANRGGYPDVQAQVSDNTGDLLLARNQPLAALEQYHQAVSTLILGWGEGLATDFPETAEVVQTAFPEHLLNHLYDKTQCLERVYRETGDSTYQTSALNHYYRLADLIDAMRYEHQVQGSKLFWREKTTSIYESAVRLCYELNDQEAGFYFLEKSKSALLLDAVQQHQARRTFAAADRLAERDLRTQLELLRMELMLPMTPEKRALLMDSLLRSQQEWEALQQVFMDRYPTFHRIRLGQNNRQPEELRRLIGGEGWLLVEYMVGKEAVYIWSMTAEGQTDFRRVEYADFQTNIQAFLEELNKSIKGGIDPTGYAQASNRLYNQIIKPELLTHPEYREVLIIPDGILTFIPFDALLLVPRWEPEEFLVHSRHIRFAFSAEVLAQQKEVRDVEGMVLTVAPVFRNRHRGQSPLLLSEPLLDNLSIRGMEVLLEEKATAENFLKLADQAYILNFFTHASADTSGSPRIEFHDRSLFLPELYAQQLRADLVILGACETGIGDIREGEGVMSLSRGFTFAGASSLIASLWKVRESNTNIMLASFYRNLQLGYSKSESWWMAKKDFLNKEANAPQKDPFNWAGFVYYGPDYPLEVLPKRPWKLWGTIGGGVALLIFLAWRLRNREEKEPENKSSSNTMSSNPL
jgi:CHAT domain-containing protein